MPGTYSLVAHSKEEEVTRDFICLEEYDLAIVVCDAVCLERNLNLALQVIDVSTNTIICVNLIDEAKKKGIEIDFSKLSHLLNVPVIGVSARNGVNMEHLQELIYEKSLSKQEKNVTLSCQEKGKLDSEKYVKKAEEIAKEVVRYTKKDYDKKNRKLDKIVTNRLTGIPIMILLLLFIFWLTITFSNYPSQLLFSFFSWLEGKLLACFLTIGVPKFVTGILILRNLQSTYLGNIGNVTTNGNFFSTFYFFRGFGIFTESCL